MIRFLLFIFLLNTSFSLLAQEKVKRQHYFIELKPHFGEPIIYSDSLTITLTKPFYAGDIRIGMQTNGERQQDQSLAFPQYGIGLYHAYLNSPDTLGQPWAVYAFYNGPIVRFSRFTLGYDLGIGVAWGLSKYDPVTNNKNDLIGSSVNVYFNGGVYLKYRVSDRLDLSAAVDFTHFSNGAMQTPNKGLNLRGGNVSLAYNFNRSSSSLYERPLLKRKEIVKIEKYNEIDFTASIGGKATNSQYGTGPIYSTSSIFVDFHHRYNWIGKFGGGFDWIFDTSLSEDYPEDESTPLSKYMFLGVHLSHELIISDVSIMTQAGTYLIKGTPAKGWFFFRLSLKYHFTPNWYTHIALKTANGFKADYIEFGLGHRFKL